MAHLDRQPVLVLRRNRGAALRLVPGERRVLGRAPATDLVLSHPSVSRLHARITWPEGRPRPVIEDLHSANGVWVGGRRIAHAAELRDGDSLGIGDYTFQLHVVEDAPPALLEDTGDTVHVRLFSEVGPVLHGRLQDGKRLRDVLLELEELRRTGTLVLSDGAQVTFARGRVVDASTPAQRGVDALRAIVSAEPRDLTYRFDLDVAARECPMTISVRAVLEEHNPGTERLARGAPKVAS